MVPAIQAEAYGGNEAERRGAAGAMVCFVAGFRFEPKKESYAQHQTAHNHHPRPRPGADTRYLMVRSMVGDLGVVATPFAARGRSRRGFTLVRLAWLIFCFLLLAASIYADQTCLSPLQP